jgi:hypothetical protein
MPHPLTLGETQNTDINFLNILEPHYDSTLQFNDLSFPERLDSFIKHLGLTCRLSFFSYCSTL